ncbi:MAG: RES family NAD+ phosphorylase [Rudanella sp.]|nr:RES family NAD+ phosphorylase [Rudanella sp.]
MLVYRLYKSTYIAEPLSAEGSRRAGGRWNPKGFPILYASATPELALLEVVAHLNPSFIPRFHLVVLDIPQPERIVSASDLPANWRDDDQHEIMKNHLSDWLKQPETLTIAVPSAIVVRSINYLIHGDYPQFNQLVKIIENEPFELDGRLIKGGS